MKQSKIIVGMSGGVDSTVAALLLLKKNYAVEGLFMKNWEEDDDADYCAAQKDLEDARKVCSDLGIVLHTVNFSSEYWDRVFSYFLQEYTAGRTPNPDVLCNKEIKFRAFLDHAKMLGADKIATGHYVRTSHTDNRVRLLRGADHDKDQSYFLYLLNQQQLQAALFPIGEYQKKDIRKMARDNQLITHDKKDSTGICFIGERRFDLFLQRYLPVNPGAIVSVDGDTLGEHSGLMYYTLGQRKGMGIGGLQQADESPWYVVDKDLASNTLIVAQGHDHPRLFHTTLECSQLHWIDKDSQNDNITLSAKIRYRQPDQSCSIVKLANNTLKVNFAAPQRAITPGQSIVFYQADTCLGGAVIDRMYNETHSAYQSA